MELYFLEELFVGELMGGVGELMHFRFSVYDVYIFSFDSSMQISNGIVFSVSETATERIDV